MDRLTIVKVGGEVIKNIERRKLFLTSFSLIHGKKLLIHGGGSILTDFADGLNIKTEMMHGRRITSEEILKLAIMAYGGLINKELVAELQALQVNSLGLTGADVNLISASKRVTNNIDYGFVGDIQVVNIRVLKNLLDGNYTLVLAPITHDGKGQLLNTNADSIAGEIAKCLINSYVIKLIYCIDKCGVLSNEKDDRSVISELKYTTYKKYKKNGIIRNGMLPKLENAFMALSFGVQEVSIAGITNFCNNYGGTLLINK